MKARVKARFLLVLTAILWGTSFPVIRYGLIYLPTFTFLTLRFSLATLILALWIIASRKGRALTAMLRDRFVIFTGVLNALGYAFQFIGQNYTYATNASLLINTSPIFTAITAHFILDEKMNKLRGGAILLAFIGSAIIIIESYGRALTFGALGDFLCLLAGFFWGIYVTYSKKLAHEETDDVILLSSWFAITTILAVPFSIIEIATQPIKIETIAIAVIFYVAIACTVVAFSLWFIALKIMEASTSSAYFILEILVSAILESIMFKTTITYTTITGAILVVTGVYLTDLFYKTEYQF